MRQNNSGGIFDFDKNYGITNYVIVECDSMYDIEKRCKEILNYPKRSSDCSCCGQRWDPFPWDEDDLTEKPMIYDKVVDKDYVFDSWFKRLDGNNACIHYKDGTKEWF
jgi:hypothetical protein